MECSLWKSFVKSKEILSVLGLAELYKVRPSTFFNIDNDAYTEFCFDEACAYIKLKMKDGESPQFKKHYKSFHDLYRQYK